MVKSYEKYPQFTGLKKAYKNQYDNVINVSIDTVDSIKQEYADPIEPAAEIYQRKRLKTTKVKNGVYQTQLVIEPFDISEDVKWELTNLVTQKLMTNSSISKRVEDEIKRNFKIQRYTKGGPQTEYDYDP